MLAKKEACLKTLIAFPDLYEIGMSNQALRIIYNRLNEISGISCDRAFAPAPDFEQLLRKTSTPVYGLDTGISLSGLDLLLFTLGYEPGINGILSMMDISGIPLHCSEREEGDPIVIAGGPAVSNPLPYSSFIDAFWIGEAEAGFFTLAEELLGMKIAGKGRAALLGRISENPHVWTWKKQRAKRAIAHNIVSGKPAVFPLPSMKTVQHHGAVEIMRGCPNGCRFCHAGFWYRPMRQKGIDEIVKEAEALVSVGGWREISLSSLSSGDYSGLGSLISVLNEKFSRRHVSFQLPSLKVSSFSLPILEEISLTRKSGLTFAVETPEKLCQFAINKEVSKEQVIAIIRQAKKSGWRTAKFYFMIGLPKPQVNGGENLEGEESAIVDFILDVGRQCNMHFNINIGVFVPKPHTPYQRAAQMESEAAVEKFDYLRNKLKPAGHKVSFSDPLVSVIEGIISRGDERVGRLIERAYLGGSRLDAWLEYIDRDVWKKILQDNWELVKEITGKREGELPWQCINSRVSEFFLLRELERSGNSELTERCDEECSEFCGCCNGTKVMKVKEPQNNPRAANEGTPDSVNLGNVQVNRKSARSDTAIFKVLFSFTKHRSAVFHGHLSLIEIFSMAFNRADIPVIYTKGFNPLIKMEFASPLSLGISADAEIAAVEFDHPVDCEDFMSKLNTSLPDGIRIQKAQSFRIPAGRKKHSVSSLLWGFVYICKDKTDYVPAREEKRYRTAVLEIAENKSFFNLRRIAVLAKDTNDQPADFFEVYGNLSES
jgi:radical SAM superfamily enzyme YgiQ (UPF0313 family)